MSLSKAEDRALSVTFKLSCYDSQRGNFSYDKRTIKKNLKKTVCILCRIQLTVCVSQILRHDFPDKWPGVINKVNGFLAENSQGTWMGALLTLYQIVKKYE